jgi:hypothetical protein
MAASHTVGRLISAGNDAAMLAPFDVLDTLIATDSNPQKT